MQNNPKIILGIDPGTVIMGYGLIRVTGGQPVLITMDVLKLSPKLDHYERLRQIHQKVQEIIDAFHPTDFAIEAPFFGKNVQSMLKLGRAQGVAIATAMQACIPVTEYSPRKIKQSITGNGNAAKEQVWKMLQHLLTLGMVPAHYDASDAVAVAICHHLQQNGFQASRKAKSKPMGWGKFIAENPKRLRKG